MADELNPPPRNGIASLIEGAFGAGLVLVFLPGVALIFFVGPITRVAPAVGLPLLAIFGIMMLFGALALVAALFAKLKLDNPSEALGLPAGSIRAAIALSLIVLFALISVMLYQSQNGGTVSITGVAEAQKNALLLDGARHVTDVIAEQACPAVAALPAASAASGAASGSASAATSAAAGTPAGCAAGERTFTVVLQQPPSQAATDLAKQLLILIGTLMTSVTSFYFGSRSSEAAATRSAAAAKGLPTADPQAGNPTPSSTGATTLAAASGGASTDASHADDSHVDGCDLPITDVTDDADLPPAQGGVSGT